VDVHADTDPPHADTKADVMPTRSRHHADIAAWFILNAAFTGMVK
jgi:hypothetical protein